jgi:DNA polymerase-3 subunit alpha
MDFYSQFTKYKLPILEDGVKLPDFKIEQKYIEKYNLSSHDCNSENFLLRLSLIGLESKIGQNHPKYQEYRKRLHDEFNVFNELGFCSYILITWDIVNHCIEESIATGFGRGSAGNCLILYLINVTQIDPIASGDLYFERFLNKTRAKFKVIDGVKYYDGSLLCDVDLDISFSDRKRLVAWLNNKYQGKIAKLPTTGTYTTKVLVKEVSKCYLEINEEEAGVISESIPVEYGKPKKIDEAIELSEDFKKFCNENPEVVKICKRLYELNKYNGVHASAWIISSEPIGDIFPLKLTKDGELCSVYTMEDASSLAIKVDILGLRCATLIDRVCKMVKIDPLKIPLDDGQVFKFLQTLQTPKGLFQIEADTNYKVLKQVKPKTLSHIAAIVALARPGVLQFAEVFARYVETGEFQSVHPFFDEILKDTAGIPLYQESLLKMANKLGFTLSESETIRRIVGKKKVEDMVEWEEKVKIKIKEQNLDPKICEDLWKIMDDSKNYSFNAGHANAYGMMSYVTAYLKYYHPKEFFLALLELSADEQNTTEEIQIIQSEMAAYGIKLLGPDLIKSKINFEICDEGIRFGLGYIKGVAQKSFEKLQDFKHEYPNKFSLFCAAQESGINMGVLCALIMSGAMDNYITETRPRTVLEAQAWHLLTKREKIRVLELGEKFNYKLIDIMNFLKKNLNEKGVPFLKPSRVLTINKKYSQYKEIFTTNSDNEALAKYWFEKTLIGYSYSSPLINILKEHYPELKSILDIKSCFDGQKVTLCGEIQKTTSGISKKKNKYIKLFISDSSGNYTCQITHEDAILREEERNNGKFAAGQIVVCEGRKGQDIVWCEKAVRQDVKIYTKLSELKAEKVKKELDEKE